MDSWNDPATARAPMPFAWTGVTTFYLADRAVSRNEPCNDNQLTKGIKRLLVCV